VQFRKASAAGSGYRFFQWLCSARIEERFGHLGKQLLDTVCSDLFVGEPWRGAAEDFLELGKNGCQKSLALGSNLAAGNKTLVHLAENPHLL
jgi:hypothetical protein